MNHVKAVHTADIINIRKDRLFKVNMFISVCSCGSAHTAWIYL